MTGRIGVVLKGYPRLSETFIAQEILELQRAGFELELISLRHPADKARHPIHEEITAPAHYLPEYLHDEPMRVFRALRAARKLPGYRQAFRKFLSDLRRDFTRNRFRRFGQALVLATEYAPELEFLYVHFIHTPAAVTRYAAMMTGRQFAVSAHAKDIWTTPEWELADKLDDCRWCVTCTASGREKLASHAVEPGKVHLVYHGIDLGRFPHIDRAQVRDGSTERDPVRLLTVGRAVAKKGIDTLLEALSQLPADLHWCWTHIGGGPLRGDLMQQAKALGLTGHCDFAGALPQADVLKAYRESDLFVLPCRVDETGDRDGLPNVMMEAQSQSLPVLTTPVSAIPELVENGRNGLLVEPDDVAGLAEALGRLISDPTLRHRLGEEGEARVRGRFDHKQAIHGLIELMSASVERQREDA